MRLGMGIHITQGRRLGSSGPRAATPSIWYGANWEILANTLTEVRSYQARITNNSWKTWISVAPLFAAMHAVPGTILGWRVRNYANAGAWTYGTIRGSASYTPAPGAWDAYNSPAILANSAVLLNPVTNGGSIEIEVALAAGNHAAGKVTTTALPSTCLTSRRGGAGQNSVAGDTTTWTSGYGQPWTHLYIGTDPAQGGVRKAGFGGDSLTANVVPIAESPNTRREGYSIVATATAVTNGDAFQVISFGRGTYTPAQMATCHEYLAAELGPDHLDWMFAQGVSYNATPSNQSSYDATIAATQSVIDMWDAKGVRTGVNFMSPPGSARNSATYLPWWNAAKAEWQTRKPGKVVDLADSIKDDVDPTIIKAVWSQDGIHVNIAGAAPHGAAAYTQTKAILVAAGEL